MHLNLTMFVCLSVERDVKGAEKEKAEPMIVVSVGPVTMTAAAQWTTQCQAQEFGWENLTKW